MSDLEGNFQVNEFNNFNKLCESSKALPHSFQSRSVVLKLEPNLQSSCLNTSEMKSLLPENLSTSILRNEQNESLQIICHSDMNSNSLNNVLFTTNYAASDQKNVPKSPDSILFVKKELANTNGNEAVEDLLLQYNSSVPDYQNGCKQNLEIGRSFSKCKKFATDSMQSYEEINMSLSQIHNNVTNSSTQEGNESLPSQIVMYDKDFERKVVKKSKIETNVKMVVCRKITIKKVIVKTGEVLETKVKTEEEEPVTLDVDCLETSEELTSESTELSFDHTPEQLTSKWTSEDGGLKFLSAVSESRQRIRKTYPIDKTFESSLKKVKLIESAPQKVNSFENHSGGSNADASSKKENSNFLEVDHLMDSENEERNEDLNDVSEDYVPSGHIMKKSCSSYRTYVNDYSDHNTVSHKNDSAILIPKRRGRKKKWDNALGVSSNHRSCVFCNKHFINKMSCIEHMKAGNCISSIFCFICSKPFNNESELEKHLSDHRNDKRAKVYECVDCYRSYRTRSGYEKHFRMGTCLKRDELEDSFTGPLECDQCPSRFSTQAYLRLHRYKVHENPKDIHTCLDCGKKFYSYVGFFKHKNGKPCTEPLKCWVCGKTYSSKAKESYKIHMRHHKSEVGGITFNCEECGRSYMTQMALTKHKLSHTGIKPYKCETCGKAFAMRYMVKDHARTHTGERPYLCSLCGNAFSNKGHLGRHLRSHENKTLQKRGRPKKIKEPDILNCEEAELKIIDLGQTFQSLDGQSLQVVNSQMYDSQMGVTPMIIQTNDNTIIIADGWPSNSFVNPTITLASSAQK